MKRESFVFCSQLPKAPALQGGDWNVCNTAYSEYADRGYMHTENRYTTRILYDCLYVHASILCNINDRLYRTKMLCMQTAMIAEGHIWHFRRFGEDSGLSDRPFSNGDAAFATGRRRTEGATPASNSTSAKLL